MASNRTMLIEFTILYLSTVLDSTICLSKSVRATNSWLKISGKFILYCWNIVLQETMKHWLVKWKEISLEKFKNSKWKSKKDNKSLKKIKNSTNKKI